MAASHFFPLVVSDIEKVSKDCVGITFDVPDNLQADFAFSHGQYLTLRTYLSGEEIRRCYSLCSSPLDKKWQVAVKKVAGGRFSEYANTQLKKGDVLDVMPPMGKFFTPLQPQNTKNYMAIAAGSGITPILSIIATTLRTEPNSRFTLVYGNKSRATILFRELLENFKNRYIDRFQLIHVLSREKSDAALQFGRIDKAKCDLLFENFIDPKGVDAFFICGPGNMVSTVQEFLLQKGVHSGYIHKELFSGNESRTTHLHKQTSVADSDQCNVTIRMDGLSTNFFLGYDGMSVLDAAILEGTQLPYACKGGVCCTCKAKLLEGTVNMEVNYGLEPDEIAAGYILTCQSHPSSPAVTIDFDAV